MSSETRNIMDRRPSAEAAYAALREANERADMLRRSLVDRGISRDERDADITAKWRFDNAERMAM